MEYYEKTVSTELKYKGNIIDVEKIMVELPNGKLASEMLSGMPVHLLWFL